MAEIKEIPLAEDLQYQHSSELSRLVRLYDKPGRDELAAKWRQMRVQNRRLANKLWVTAKKAQQQAIVRYWSTPTCTSGGLADLIAEHPENG
jgi:hypothetical protein